MDISHKTNQMQVKFLFRTNILLTSINTAGNHIILIFILHIYFT